MNRQVPQMFKMPLDLKNIQGRPDYWKRAFRWRPVPAKGPSPAPVNPNVAEQSLERLENRTNSKKRRRVKDFVGRHQVKKGEYPMSTRESAPVKRAVLLENCKKLMRHNGRPLDIQHVLNFKPPAKKHQNKGKNYAAFIQALLKNKRK